MKYRRDYEKLFRAVPSTAIDPKTKALMDDFGKYFQKFADHPVILYDVFVPRFRGWHPTLTEEQFNSYKAILKQVIEDVDETTREGVLADLYELNLGTTIANTVSKYSEGELELPLYTEISAALDTYKFANGVKDSVWNDKSIEELLIDEDNVPGLKWRLQVLNNHMRPLRGGDFGIVAARPDKGKTSFLADQISFMAAQLPSDRNVIWLNNEGKSDTIKKRIFQATFGMSWSTLRELKDKGKPIMEAYTQIIGRRDKIRVMDIHECHVGQVEQILDNNNPGLVIFDMIDNIRGFGREARTDLRLEEMYKWGRERSVKYDFVGLASSQISGDGDGEQYPKLWMLKDSRTGKQGACEFILMIGSSNDINLQYSRFLSLPKNKLRRDDAPGDPHSEVIFKPTIARYEDIENG